MTEETEDPAAAGAEAGSLVDECLGKRLGDQVNRQSIRTQAEPASLGHGIQPYHPVHNPMPGALAGWRDMGLTPLRDGNWGTSGWPDRLAPITVAVHDGACRLCCVLPGSGSFSPSLTLPTVVLFLDDWGHATGPDSFDKPSLSRLARRCGAAVLTMGESSVALYRVAAQVAAHGRKHVLLIETRPLWRGRWQAALRAANPHLGVIVGFDRQARCDA